MYVHRPDDVSFQISMVVVYNQSREIKINWEAKGFFYLA